MMAGIMAGGVSPGSGVEPGFWSRVARFTLNLSAGEHDLAIPGFGWTPKAAIFTVTDCVTGDSTSTHAVGGFGAADGTSQFAVGFRSRGGVSLTAYNRRRSATDEAVMLLDVGGGINIEANVVSFIPGGVRINIGDAGPAHLVTVQFFGGTSLSAKVGTLNTSTSPVSVTTGWRPEAMAFFAPWDANFSDADLTGISYALPGFASFDGTTIRQASTCMRIDDGSPSNTRGGISNDKCITLASLGGSLLGPAVTAADATSFTVTYAAATIYMGYLALNFGGAASAWAGTLASPTSTGVQNLTSGSVGFTPNTAIILPTMAAADNTIYTDGQGATAGLSAISSNGAYANSWRVRDNITGNSQCGAQAFTKALYHNDDAGTLAFDASAAGFVANGISLNFATTNGTARRLGALLIG